MRPRFRAPLPAVFHLLVTLPGLCALAGLAIAPAQAGQNAGAVAHLYWQVGNTTADTARLSISGRPKLLVTVTGLVSFRGADIQLLVAANSGGPLPDAWQGNGSNGCNDGKIGRAHV